MRVDPLCKCGAEPEGLGGQSVSDLVEEALILLGVPSDGFDEWFAAAVSEQINGVGEFVAQWVNEQLEANGGGQ